jgi:DNA-binding SARP family transcriptional activator
VRLSLLGGFEVECAGFPLPSSAWSRRGGDARRVLKLLAVDRKHELHRELIQERLWPDTAPQAVRNRLHKALHAARHALQPDLEQGAESDYVISHGDLLRFATDRVWIDIDEFERCARRALRTTVEDDLHAACRLYTGELLPEDRYEEWSLGRRTALADLYCAVLIALARQRQEEGDRTGAFEMWQAVLAADPLEEEAHRAIMVLHVARGRSNAALRHYREVCGVVRRELDTQPEPATQELYRDILAGRLQQGGGRPASISIPRSLPAAIPQPSPGPLIGRDAAMVGLHIAIKEVLEGHGRVVFLRGEAGAGKSRIAAELACQAHQRGVLVLWSSGDGEGQPAYGPLIDAIDSHVSLSSADEREQIARRFPVLAPLIPTLAASDPLHPLPVEMLAGHVSTALGSFFIWLATQQPVLLVLDNLQHAGSATLHLVRRLARDVGQRRLLLLGAFREEEITAEDPLDGLVVALRRERPDSIITLSRLTRQESNQLVRALLGGAAVHDALLDQLYARSLGNPLFLIELIDAMCDGKTMILKDGCWRAAPRAALIIPPGPRELVRARLARLDSAGRRIVQLAAVAGPQWPFTDLQAVALTAFSGLDCADVHDALQSAIGRAILDDRGDSYVFHSPLFQEAVLSGMPQYRLQHLREIVERHQEERKR